MSDPFTDSHTPSELFRDVRRVGSLRREGRERERRNREVVNTIGEYDASIPPFLWEPPPTLTTLEPTSGLLEPVTLTLTGSSFMASSVVHAGPVALPTTYVSATELTALYTPTTGGSVPITVHNGPRVSNGLEYVATAPTLSSVAPSSVNIDELATLTLTGSSFTSGSVVYADGAPLPTTYVSATELTATITPVAEGAVALTVHTAGHVSDELELGVLVPFRPDLIAGLRGWWDAADEATLTYSSGTEVSEWADKSAAGSGYPFIQSTIASQPTWQAAAQNGNGRFAYTQPDALECTFSGGPLATYPHTFYVVLNRYGPSYVAPLCSLDYGGRDHWQSDTVTSSYSVLSGQLSWPVASDPNALAVYSFRINTNGVVRVNGAAIATASLVDGGGNNSALQLGWRTGPNRAAESWRHFISHFHELIVYNGAHDDATMAQVEAYLRDKWGTP